MILRSFADVPYLPFLSLRPAEMRALEELPDATKRQMLPLVHLRPWTTAFQLQSGLDRLTEAYGARPTVIAVGREEHAINLRPVHAELAKLRQSDGGYANWCDFIADEGHEHFIPAVQIEDEAHIEQQVGCFYELGRGLVVIIPRVALGGLRRLVTTIAAQTDRGRNTCFVIDEGVMSRDSLERSVFLVTYCSTIREICPEATISISGSSFPESFTSIINQEIFERTVFDTVVSRIGRDRMIYSDRGSARVERQQGGGGLPKPRIDYPQPGRWSFFRSTDDEGFAGYQAMATALCRAEPPIFDNLLRIWGTLMIERTANGDTSAIKTPARSTAVRINLHLHRQTFFGDPIGLYDTEDDWQG